MVQNLGMKFVELPGNPEQVLASDDGADFLRTPSSPLELVSRFSKLFFPLLSKSLVDSLPACRSTNAIVASPLAYYGYDIAQALNVPFFPCSLLPMTPTSEFPFPMIQSPIAIGSFGNQMSYSVARQVFWQFMRDNLNPWRKEYLNLPALGVGDEPTARMESSGVVFLYGFSTAVLPRPSDWPPRHQITGYWTWQFDQLWQPDEKLKSFIDSSQNLIAFRFGTMSKGEQTRMCRIVCEALQATDATGILFTDLESPPPDVESASRMVQVPSIAMPRFLPRCRVAVHYCDTETSGLVMTAGLPSVPTPIFGDQFFWARRMNSIGVASRPIETKDFNAVNLANQIKIAMANTDIANKCSKLSERLKSEDGIANAVTYLSNRIK